MKLGIGGAKGRTKQWRTTQPDLTRRLPYLVERRFQAAAPDELWVADFTYLRSWQGVVFLSFVIDVWSRRVVGWQFASNMRRSLVSSTRYAWRSPDAAAALMSSSYTTPTSKRERATTHH